LEEKKKDSFHDHITLTTNTENRANSSFVF